MSLSFFFISRIFPQPSRWSVLPCWSGKNLTIISLVQQFLMADSVKLLRPVWLVVLVKTCQWCSRRTTLLAIWATCLMARHRLAASPPVKRYATKMLEPLSSKSFSLFSCVPGCYGCLQWRFIHLPGATDQRGKTVNIYIWCFEGTIDVKVSWQLLGIELGTLGLDHQYSVTALQWAGVCTCVVCWYGYGFSCFLSRYEVHHKVHHTAVSFCYHFSSSCFYSNTTIIF